MLLVIGKISHRKYHDILDMVSTKCDVFSFAIPDFGYRIITKSNKHTFHEFDTKESMLHEIAESRDLYSAYEERIQGTRNALSKYLVHSFTDVKYLNQIRQHRMTIELYKITKESICVLAAYTNDLYSWTYPAMPEDLCFFIKGKCFLQSIAHEGLCFIYPQNSTDISIIKRIGLKYLVYQDVDDENTPTMEY